MVNVKVKLNSISDVKSFVNDANRCSGNVLVKSDRYAVDGKSIMGVFSLDVSKNCLDVELDNDTDKAIMQRYIV